MPAPASITQQELNLITSAAENAPLQNMQHAAALSQALQNFRAWIDYAQRAISTVESLPVAEQGTHGDEPSC